MHFFRRRSAASTLLSAVLSLALLSPSVAAQPKAPDADPPKAAGKAKANDEAKADKAEKKAAGDKKAKNEKTDKKAKADKKADKKGKDKPEGDAAPETPAVLPLSESLTGEAKEAYDAGKLLYADGDFSGARLKFERAHELSSDPRLLWNMAAAEKQQRRYDRVLSLVERYLKEGGDKLTDTDRQEAKSLIEMVRALVSEVTVTVTEPGAEVTVDGEKVGESPLAAPLVLTQGERAFRVEKPGFVTFSETKNLQGGTKVTLDVALKQVIRQGKLRVVAGLRDSIYVDGKLVARGQWEGTLSSGTHTLTVSGKGKRTQRTDVVVEDEKTRTERVVLEVEPKAGPPERDTSSSGGTWMFIAGGAALAVGLGVTAYLLLKPEGETRETRAAGTLPPGSVSLHF